VSRVAAVLEPPPGLVYEPAFLSEAEQAELVGVLDVLDFRPIVMRGQTARRTARHYGVGYDYDARTSPGDALEPAEPIPPWLAGLRERSAALAGRPADELVEALVQRYPPGATIGWHRDAPMFGVVVGVSLGSACRMRFQRTVAGERAVREVVLEPGSAYALMGQARWSWQHSIPPTPALRYSVTFRSLRRERREGGTEAAG
jgi:alkylated DNA repair protein (DNA oxidative demethylase)